MHSDEFEDKVLGERISGGRARDGELRVHTVSRYVVANLRHCVADIGIGGQQVMMLARIPLHERGQLLGDGLEQSNDHPDRCCLHVAAELVDGGSVGYTVVAIKLYALPNGKKYGCEDEDRGSILELVAAVDA